MKVHVSYTEEVDDDFRRAINAYYGKEGLATREEVKRWFRNYGSSMNVDVMFELGDGWKDDEENEA